MRAWRDQLSLSTARQYAALVPGSMPSAFVLQWTLEAAAEAGVHAARHDSVVVHPVESGLSFELQPSQLYPVAAQYQRARATTAPLGDRLAAARAAYRIDAVELALGYHSPVRLGPHTRLAMVDDVWAMTLARASGQRPPQRGSCCFIYVLPGVHECAGCPRVPGPAS
ncbi:(2Fe-2S)-binding protein [Pedococcus bigeumensis]|uniref:(2Fe-2S)-binding protein n=1 Tax=Pedococcus bigeumensis TaxID=433644 RepID=UPI002FE7906A